MRDASIGVAKGRTRIGVKRRIGTPKSLIDDEVGIIRIDDGRGTRLATLIDYACHAVVINITTSFLFPADYPGVVQRLIEKEAGGVCLFRNGACGNINALYSAICK